MRATEGILRRFKPAEQLDVWMSHGDRVISVPKGFKVLADTPHADVRVWLGRRATTRHWLFRTVRLRKSSLELSAIITALAIRNEDDSDSKHILDLARKSRNPGIRRAALQRETAEATS